MMTLKQLVARFTVENWALVSSNERFLQAITEKEFEQALVIGQNLLREQDEALASIEYARHAEYERCHAEACRIVSEWARLNGRTGAAHAQARQSRIRKIVKHGLDSDYARRVMAEAGMITE